MKIHAICQLLFLFHFDVTCLWEWVFIFSWINCTDMFLDLDWHQEMNPGRIRCVLNEHKDNNWIFGHYIGVWYCILFLSISLSQIYFLNLLSFRRYFLYLTYYIDWRVSCQKSVICIYKQKADNILILPGTTKICCFNQITCLLQHVDEMKCSFQSVHVPPSVQISHEWNDMILYVCFICSNIMIWVDMTLKDLLIRHRNST